MNGNTLTNTPNRKNAREHVAQILSRFNKQLKILENDQVSGISGSNGDLGKTVERCRNRISGLTQLLARLEAFKATASDVNEFYAQYGNILPADQKNTQNNTIECESYDDSSQLDGGEQMWKNIGADDSFRDESKLSEIRAMLIDSFANKPTHQDLDQTQQYIPVTPWVVLQNTFPISPASNFNSPSLFQSLDDKTKLFVFFYQQGQYQQFLAANELIKNGWQYYPKSCSWVKRCTDALDGHQNDDQVTFLVADPASRAEPIQRQDLSSIDSRSPRAKFP